MTERFRERNAWPLKSRKATKSFLVGLCSCLLVLFVACGVARSGFFILQEKKSWCNDVGADRPVSVVLWRWHSIQDGTGGGFEACGLSIEGHQSVAVLIICILYQTWPVKRSF